MTCPGPDPEACCDDTACPSCPRVVIAGTEWRYSTDLGWHEPVSE